MRLTKESGCFDETTIYTIISEPNRIFFKMNECVQKLGQLEDIEEELGIDLITFFKYLSAKEVFFINDFNKIQRAVVRSIIKNGLIVFEKAFSWGECDFTLYFNDYGKTWALTKEELK